MRSAYLPSPGDVAVAFKSELLNGNLLYHLGVTFLRVIGAFAIAMTTGSASLCALGRSAPNPVLSTLRFFEHEYEAGAVVEVATGRIYCPARVAP